MEQNLKRREGLFYLWLPLLLLLASCARPISVESSATLFTVDSSFQAANEYVSLIAPYKNRLDKEMNEVIARGERELKKNVGESPLGNLVADMQLDYSEDKFGYKINISVINNGGLRNSLPEGDITVGNVYELSPFENFIYILELTAADVRDLAEYAVRVKNLGIAGLNLESQDGELISMTVGQEAVERDQIYLLAINDYLANGGDHMNFLIPLPRIVASDVLLREMLLEQIKSWAEEGKPIDARIEGRQKLN